NLNMVILFGGAVPDDGSASASPLHLFSAEIKFWNTPDKAGFPLALGNHSGVIDMATGDMIVHGGVLRGDSALTAIVSNTTMHMVTMPSEHLPLNASPTGLLVIVLPPPAPPAPPPPPSKPTTTTRTEPATTRTITAAPTVTSTVATRTVTRTALSATGRPTPTAEPEPTSETSSGGLLGLPISLGLFGKRDGSKDSSSDSNKNSVVDSMIMTWTNATQPYGVAGREGHTATVLGGSTMVVIGGFSEGNLVEMQTLFVYDAVKQVWRKRTAGGQVPPARRNHVATLVNGTVIVVHGGANADFSQALDDVAVLNTTTWTWQRPVVANPPAARYAHSAVQAGPYMLLMFGYVPDNPTTPRAGDKGIQILDTTSWLYVSHFDPGRAHLSMMFKSQKLTGGTIFGLFAASLVALLVLLIMAYVGCAHYYNRHPRANNDENMVMLPGSELRNFGRRITMRLGVRPVARPAPARPQTRFLANRTNSSLSLNLSPTHAPRLSLTPTHDSMGAMPSDCEKPHPSFDATRFSRRTHLDDVELPAGLRNRDTISAANTLGGTPVPGAPAPLDVAGLSRPTTAASQAHGADALLASLTLPLPPAARASRSSTHIIGLQLDPALGHADALRPWTADTVSSGHTRPSGSLRDSIDINTLLAQNHHFFVANPDD
ncbi:hypothetical protein H4R19_001283, partial [Coemansia spiralis]